LTTPKALSENKLSASKELEELQNKRTNLEEQSRSLEEKEKALEERVKIVEEKLAIQELEDHNQTKLDAVKNLEAKISELEKRLKKPFKEPQPESFKPPEEPTPTPEIAETVKEEPTEEETTEGYVEVTAIDDSTVNQQIEQIDEDTKKQHEKKKRRIF
jgi:hypothetical protein